MSDKKLKVGSIELSKKQKEIIMLVVSAITVVLIAVIVSESGVHDKKAAVSPTIPTVATTPLPVVAKAPKLDKSLPLPAMDKSLPLPAMVKSELEDISVTINKIEQTKKELKLYVEYMNNSGTTACTADSLAVLVYDGKQYEYDFEFNFNRYYNKIKVAPSTIETTVTAKSVIFFRPLELKAGKKLGVILSMNDRSARFEHIHTGSITVVE